MLNLTVLQLTLLMKWDRKKRMKTWKKKRIKLSRRKKFRRVKLKLLIKTF